METMPPEKKDFWKPSVTADVVVINTHLAKWRDDGCFINLILVKRSEKSDAYSGCWALPGGFLERGESLEQCALRELKEETGLEAKMLAPMIVCSKPDRDPRGQVISYSYFTQFCSTDEQPLATKAGDDASAIGFFNLKGSFDKENGSLSVKLLCVENGAKIGFKAVFSRGDLGLVTTDIEYDTRYSNARLAFDHAEIIARTILRVPDLVLPTSDNFGRSRVEHETPPDPNSDAELKKRIAKDIIT